MKKIKILMTVLCCICLLAGCGTNVEVNFPSYLFEEEGSLESTADSMKNSEGVKKVTVNEDGSMTVSMTEERHKEIVDAAFSTVNSIPLFAISENTAIRDFVINEDFTEINITVNKNSSALEDEVDFVIYAVRLYHVCSLNDVEIKVSYIDSETGHLYMDKFYDIKGNKEGSNTYFTEEEAETAPWKS